MLGDYVSAGRLVPGTHKAPLEDIHDVFVASSLDRVRRQHAFDAMRLHIDMLEPSKPEAIYAAGSLFTDDLVLGGATKMVYSYANLDHVEAVLTQDRACSIMALVGVISDSPNMALERLLPIGGLVDPALACPETERLFLADLAIPELPSGEPAGYQQGIIEVIL